MWAFQNKSLFQNLPGWLRNGESPIPFILLFLRRTESLTTGPTWRRSVVVVVFVVVVVV